MVLEEMPIVALRMTDLVVEQSGEDETDAGASRAANVTQNFRQGAHAHCHHKRPDNDEGGDNGESGIGYLNRSSSSGRRRRTKRATREGAPFEDVVNAGTARVNLKRIGKHDKDDDGGASNGGRPAGLVLGNNVAEGGTAERKIACEGYKDVNNTGRAD